MARLTGEAHVKITAEDVADLQRLLDDPSFIHAVGTDNVPKFAAVIAFAGNMLGDPADG